MKFSAKLSISGNKWNVVELFAILLFLCGLTVRFIENNLNTYVAARILFSISLLLWYIKSLKYYTVFRNIGPKLVMIEEMVLYASVNWKDLPFSYRNILT